MHGALRAGLVAGLATLVLAPSALAAHAEVVPGELIVRYKAGATLQQQSNAASSAGVVRRLSTVQGADAVRVRIRGSVRAAAARLRRSSAVEYVEPNYIYRAMATPNDPSFGELYGLDNTGQTGGTADADIDAPEGWDAAGLGAFPATGGAKIGIVDTGIMQLHEEFAGKISDCGGVNDFGLFIGIGADPTIVDDKCEDDHGHGTHVAGTAAATANNGVGVAGVAFNAPLAICKGLDAGGSGTVEMIANCITWLSEHGVKVISMSLGGAGGSETLQTAVSNATAAGSLLVAAAGNTGDSSLSYPAAYEEVASVAATDASDERAEFSTFNDDVEVAAPGVDILSTWNDGAYDVISGTSMATPHASGVASLIAFQTPDAGVAGWRSTLDAAVDDKGAAGRDPEFGFGRLSLEKALQP